MAQISTTAMAKLVLLRWQSQYYCDGKVSTTAMAKLVLLRWQSGLQYINDIRGRKIKAMANGMSRQRYKRRKTVLTRMKLVGTAMQ